MSSSYPKDLMFFLNRLNGWSSNSVKLNPVGSKDNIAPSSLIEVELPQNTLVDMKSFAMNFACTFDGNATTIPPRWFPQTMIRRVEVQVNGITMSAGANNYNVVYHTLAECTTPEDFGRYSALNMHGQPSGTLPIATADVALANFIPTFTATNWIGFLGSSQWLNTGLLGSVRVRIQLDSAVVMSQLNAVGDSTYTLSNLDFTCMVASLDDGLYQQALLERLASGSQVSYPFKSYYTFEQQNTGGNGSLKGTLSSSSVDRVTALIRASNYNDKAVLSDQVTTYLGGTTPYFTACGSGPFAAAAASQNLQGIDVGRTTAELHSWQFLINSNYSPNYLVHCKNTEGKGGLSAHLTRLSYGTNADVTSGDQLNYSGAMIYPYVGGGGGGPILNGAAQGGGAAGPINRANQFQQQWNYKQYHCYMSVPLEYVGSEERLVSGSNFRGSVGVIFFNFETSAHANNTMMIVECTSVLKIGAGGSAELIV